MLRKIPFIKPMAPTLAKVPPAGPDWIHEVKFDGWRAQVHIEDGAATLYSKNGADITRRFRSLRPAFAASPRTTMRCRNVRKPPKRTEKNEHHFGNSSSPFRGLLDNSGISNLSF
jgi:ATP dependent DNA ligase domain